jgi:hypothetical protein
MESMKTNLLFASLLFLLIMPTVALSMDSIPNAMLRVTVQQREDGRVSKGLHLLELSCWEGKCSLSSVSLNQCFDFGSGKKAFFPKVQYSATWSGNLKVKNEGNTLVVQETGSDAFGEYVNNLRFEYQAVGDVVNRLVGFSGGYIKNSDLLKKVITVEYVPLQKADQIMKLDCDVLLPGVDKQK